MNKSERGGVEVKRQEERAKQLDEICGLFIYSNQVMPFQPSQIRSDELYRSVREVLERDEDKWLKKVATMKKGADRMRGLVERLGLVEFLSNERSVEAVELVGKMGEKRWDAIKNELGWRSRTLGVKGWGIAAEKVVLMVKLNKNLDLRKITSFEILELDQEQLGLVTKFVEEVDEDEVKKWLEASVIRRSMGETRYALPVMARQLELCKTVEGEEVIKDLFEFKVSEKSWGERVEMMERLLKIMGYGQVEAERVNREAVGKLKNKDRKKFSNLSYKRQRQWVMGLRNLLGEGWFDEAEKRLLLGGEGIKQEGLDRKRDRARWEEETAGDYLEHLLVSLGYEIEFKRPQGRRREDYLILEKAGLVLGGGDSGSRCFLDYEDMEEVVETSPPPAWSDRTLNYIFGRWIQAGLIDLERSFGQTVHLNVGVVGMHNEMEVMARLIRLTGYVWMPRLVSSKRSFYHYSSGDYDWGIFRKSSYTEIKGYSLQTESGMMSAIKGLSALGMAVKAVSFKRRNRRPTKEQKELAKVWEEAEGKWSAGLRAMDLEELVVGNDDGEGTGKLAMAKVVSQMNGVFIPSKKGNGRIARYGSSKGVGNREGWVNGIRYTSVVELAREVMWEAVGKVERVKRGAKERFMELLKAVEASGEIDDEKLRELFSEFPCGIKGYRLRQVKLSRYRELKQRYLGE